MTNKDFNKIIDYIVKRCVELKNKYVEEEVEIEYLAIFSQNQEEYNQFLTLALSIGEIVDQTPTGPVFKFNFPPQTIAGKPKLIKIRIPDNARPQRGDVDFNTNYQEFKQKYLDNKRFALIEREKFEMIELKDDKFDVLVYFSSIPQSKLLEVV